MKVVLGVGHEKDAAFGDLLHLCEACLRRAGLDAASVGGIASIESRAASGLIAELARHFAVAAQYFPAVRLEAETPRLMNPSEALFRRIGCHGVAEAAALAAVGAAAILLVPKTKGAGVTCAIAGIGPIADKSA